MKSKTRIIRAFVFKETFKSFGLIVFCFVFLLGQLLFNFLFFEQISHAADFKNEQILIIVNVAFLLGWILFFQSWFNYKFFRKNFKKEILRLEFSSLTPIWKIFFWRFFINQLLSIFIIIISWVAFITFLVISKADWEYFFTITSPIFMVAVLVNFLICAASIGMQMILPFLATLPILTMFVTSLSISDYSANLHFVTTKKDKQPADDVQSAILNSQMIAIDEIVEVYNLAEENPFMDDLLKSFQFWNYAFKNSECQSECKIQEEDVNEVYSAIFNDYLFLDLNIRNFGEENEVHNFELNYQFQNGQIVWENQMVAKKLRPLEIFNDINIFLADYYSENKFGATREQDWKTSIFNQARENNKDVKNNVFNSDNILQALVTKSEDNTISSFYKNEDILEVYQVANNFIDKYFYQNLKSLSPLDLNADNSEAYFYGNKNFENVNDDHKNLMVSSGERALTGTILSFVRNASNYNYNLWNQKTLDSYRHKQQTNVGLNFMSQFWMMNNYTFTSNRIEYHKSNGSLIKAANSYYDVKFDTSYSPVNIIVRTSVNELVERKVKIDHFKQEIIFVWLIYLCWFLVAVILLIISYIIFSKKFLSRR